MAIMVSRNNAAKINIIIINVKREINVVTGARNGREAGMRQISANAAEAKCGSQRQSAVGGVGNNF